MLKLFSHTKCVCSLFCALFFSFVAFGQTAEFRGELKSSFKKFSLVRLNNQTVLRNVKSGQSLTIQFAGKNLELNLTPNDLRAANYRAEDTNADKFQSLEKSAVTTYKGNIAGAPDSEVRLTIDRTKIEGFFKTADGEKFFIEPARNYSPNAGAEDFVVYNEGDSLKDADFACNSELEEKIERGKDSFNLRDIEKTQALKVLELATEADFQFVSDLGGAANANNEILSLLNMIEGTYNSQLNLSIKVTYQHTWSTADPFDGTNSTTLITTFRNYWNANLPQAQYPRNTAHLFTARANLSGAGLAYIGVVCSNPTSAYGLSGRTVSVAANNLITAHEIGHNLGARHVDATQNCASTIMNAALSDSVPMTFCDYSRTEIGNYVAANSSCLSERTPAATCFDFDGDRKSDLSVFRPSSGIWFITKSADNSFDYKQFGLSTDKLVPADYDGDGKVDVAVYRSGNWYRLKSTTNTFDGIAFGAATDIPAPADFDGDGKADLAVFRPASGAWFQLMSGSGNSTSVQFGGSGDVPVAGDFDGDGKADISIFRQSNGAWYRLNSQNNGFFAVQFGQNGDKPLAADFDGDGKADLAVFRPSAGGWYRMLSSNNSFVATSFGASTDIPTPADYDGDGKTDISVFRPSDGTWYRFNSGNGAFVAYQFGSATDIPIPAYYLQ